MTYGIEQVKDVFFSATKALFDAKDYLSELDGKSGDGDMGISMEKGALALNKELEAYAGQDIGECLLKCAISFNRAAPSTMGTLISSAVMMLGREYRGKSGITAEDIVKAPRILAEAIMSRGKAILGDKTVLDALIPMAGAMESAFAASRDLCIALKEAAAAARQGAEGTKGMMAKAGRARWIAERAQEFPDGGAVLCAVIAEALANQ